MSGNPQFLGEQGKQAFQSHEWGRAADLFRAAAQEYADARDAINSAEMKNNLSVTLLQAGKAKESLEAALGTEKIFATAGDLKRQGMALGNQAAALEALKRSDDALLMYEKSASLFSEAGEEDLRAMVLQSAAAIKLKRGKVGESAFKMMGSLDAKQSPSFLERILRSMFHFLQR
jgi:tetratricopeptide (TPR) repeat protein